VRNRVPRWDNRVIHKVMRAFTLSLGLLSAPIPSFSGIHKVKKFLLNLSMKWWNSAFHARGLRLIISSCTVRSSEIVCKQQRTGGAQEKGKTGWNLVYDQNWWFSEFYPSLNNANILFCRIFFSLTLWMTKLRVVVLCFSYLLRITLML
jgi:hypothetical protein